MDSICRREVFAKGKLHINSLEDNGRFSAWGSCLTVFYFNSKLAALWWHTVNDSFNTSIAQKNNIQVCYLLTHILTIEAWNLNQQTTYW